MNHLAKIFILGFVTALGGSFGYLVQADFFEAWPAGDGSSIGSRDDLLTSISRQEFRERTDRGWRIGGLAGAGVGLLLVAKLSSNRD